MKKLNIKLWQDFNSFYEKIKPKSSKNYSKKKNLIFWDILYGLTMGQKCFLNTIVQNMNHYTNSLKNFKTWKINKILSKTSQIAKISEYLNENISKLNNEIVYG